MYIGKRMPNPAGTFLLVEWGNRQLGKYPVAEN